MICLLAIPAAMAAAILAAAWLDRRGGQRPGTSLALPARLVMPHTGHHRDKYPLTPAPEHGPVQAGRPGDPPRANGAVRGAATIPAPRGAVRAGQALDPAAGPPWQPAAAAILPPSDGAATLPQPASLGLGQPFPPEVVPYPDGNYAIRDEHGEWHIRPLAWDGRSPRETGGQPALVRPAWRTFDEWRDMAVNVP